MGARLVQLHHPAQPGAQWFQERQGQRLRNPAARQVSRADLPSHPPQRPDGRPGGLVGARYHQLDDGIGIARHGSAPAGPTASGGNSRPLPRARIGPDSFGYLGGRVELEPPRAPRLVGLARTGRVGVGSPIGPASRFCGRTSRGGHDLAGRRMDGRRLAATARQGHRRPSPPRSPLGRRRPREYRLNPSVGGSLPESAKHHRPLAQGCPHGRSHPSPSGLPDVVSGGGSHFAGRPGGVAHGGSPSRSHGIQCLEAGLGRSRCLACCLRSHPGRGDRRVARQSSPHVQRGHGEANSGRRGQGARCRQGGLGATGHPMGTRRTGCEPGSCSG